MDDILPNRRPYIPRIGKVKCLLLLCGHPSRAICLAVCLAVACLHFWKRLTCPSVLKVEVKITRPQDHKATLCWDRKFAVTLVWKNLHTSNLVQVWSKQYYFKAWDEDCKFNLLTACGIEAYNSGMKWLKTLQFVTQFVHGKHKL